MKGREKREIEIRVVNKQNDIIVQNNEIIFRCPFKNNKGHKWKHLKRYHFVSELVLWDMVHFGPSTILRGTLKYLKYFLAHLD